MSLEYITVIDEFDIECPKCKSSDYSVMDRPAPDELLVECDNCHNEFIAVLMGVF